MDYNDFDKRMFKRDYDSGTTDPRVSMRNVDNDTDPRVSMRNSFQNDEMDPVTQRIISYHAQLSRSVSVNNELIKELESLRHERAPLQKQPSSSVKFKPPINHKKHSCTDVHCLIIFTCFIGAWLFIAGYAFSKGDLEKVLIPTDSNNAKCGLDSGVRNKPMLFYYNLNKCIDPMTPLTGCDTKQICVESCPELSFDWENMPNLEKAREKLICDSNVDKRNIKDLSDVAKYINKDLCSGWYLKSIPFFNHCVWDFSQNLCDALPKYFTSRKRRTNSSLSELIDFAPIKAKYEEFKESTKSLCRKNSNSTTAMVTIQDKVEQSNSNLNRIIAAIASKFNYSNKEIVAENVALDLKNSWKVIIFAVFIHLFAVLLFITLLRWLAGPLVWISICGVVMGLGFSFVYSFQQYRLWSTEPHVPHHGAHLMAKVQSILENGDVWLYTTIVLGAFLTIILLIVFVIRKRIKVAVAIIKEASRAIMSIKSSIFFPIFPGILYLFVSLLSIIIMLYLSSIGTFSFIMVRQSPNSTEKCICQGPAPEPYKLGDKCEPVLFEENCFTKQGVACIEHSCSFNEIVKTRETEWFMLFNIVGFLWVTFFISGYEDMVLACTFSMWYWTFNKKKIPKLPVLKAVWITSFYHLGTVAFGSLILTICRLVRYVLEFIEKKSKLYNNALTRAILCCMKCFFWLLENFLRFLNRNAYITCAIHSTSFCESSRKAFSLITQNILRVYAVDNVSSFLFFLSKLLVTGCTSLITLLTLKSFPTFVQIHYPFVPIALVAVIAYVIAHFIFKTYSMAVDTLFFCFLEDSNENDGSAEKPFYMSKELCKLLGKSKAKRKQMQN